MQAKFQPKRLQQARHLKRMSLGELGVASEISRQALSQFERGERMPLPETMEKLASVLSVPTEFFLRPIGRLEGSARTVVHYRSLKRTRDIIKEQQRAATILELCAAVVDTLEQHIEYQAASVPRAYPSSGNVLKLSGDEVEDIAAETRKMLGLGNGPISDMALLVENLSVPIIYTPLPRGMDGMSAWFADRPFIVVSSECSYARSRLNIAHEFGHLILHQEISEEMDLDTETFNIVEPQAWRFAGAFMLPAKSFLSEIYSVSVEALSILKKKWGVSIAAMIKRLHDLDVIDDAQRRNLNIQLRIKGMNKREPGDDMSRERARLINRAATFLSENGDLSIHGLAAEAMLPRQFLAEALELAPEQLLPPPPKNVIQFKMKNGPLSNAS
ncbi:MAG: ImmA/IrrE family metallo-endopeptidase [Proteobacteria bacterium]|nr:ImmA/IrrE family metallo-endopeptidase [Pseudomonadota bacterium]